MRPSRRLRAIGAAAFLVLLVVGVPVLLVRLVGSPLPGSVPDPGNVITRLRQGDIPADVVINTIAAVVWIAWFQLVWSVLWEAIVNVPRLASGRVWRPPPLVLSPVGDGVARLFSVILAAGVIASASPGVAAALSTPDVVGESFDAPATLDIAAVATDSDESRAVESPMWRVSADDDLWTIAEQALGDGSLVDQIVDLNPGLRARTLEEGMLLVLPAGATAPTRTAAATSLRPPDAPEPVVETNRTESTPADSFSDTGAHDPIEVVDESETAVGRYVVQENDGMWNVAAALLGDGARHVEMTQLAVGQEVAPGVVFDADTFVIQPGWVFSAERVDPANAATGDAPETHVVEPGDTLSDIAAEHLGDQADWTEIWEQNENDDMGGGRTFDDPDLILPGWELDLPADPTVAVDPTDVTPEEAPVETDAPTSDADEVEADALPDGVDAGADVPADVLDDAEITLEWLGDPSEAGSADTSTLPPVTETVTETADVAPIPSSTSTSEPRVGSSSNAPDASGTFDVDAPRAPSPIRMEYAALLAAGVLTLVGVRRRRALRAALPHARVPAPPPEVASTERRLRTIDVGERAARVDVASRAAAHAVVGSGTRIGTIRIAKDGEVLVRLTAEADLPGPWEGSGASWALPASVPIEMLGEDARRVGQPCLALVTIGLDSAGRDVLIDLEAAGATIVAAQPDQADDVVRAIGAGLATSLNAETAHLVTSKLGTAFLLDHPNVHSERNVTTSFATAVSLVGSTIASEHSSFDLRARRTGGEMWEPAVLLFSHDDDAGAGLDDKASITPGRGLAFVASSSKTQVCPSIVGARLRARSDGWTLDAFGEKIEIVPIGVNADDIAAVVDLLDDAARPIESTHAIDQTTREPVADPITPLPHDIVVRLMGGVEIVDANGAGGAFERSKTVELISWLATHRDRATRSAARTALWELDVRDATFANVVSEARRGLGRLTPPPVGEEWLARTLNESLPLHERVVTDVDLIEQRVTHARQAPPAHAVDVLKPAVEMIHGLPFAGTSYLWPDADGITSNLVLLATTAACELAGHALSMGDTDLVFWATGQGLKVLPGHEELIGFRMRAHARAGDLAGVRSEWESYERVITVDSWSDGEPAPKLLDLRRALLTSSG